MSKKKVPERKWDKGDGLAEARHCEWTYFVFEFVVQSDEPAILFEILIHFEIF
jgi:hypothetical protein